VIIHPDSISAEQKFITSLAGGFPRHPAQLNRIFEADAEIIDLENMAGRYLVVKTDGIHEEIRQKLYEDPWLIGWMTITAPMSDMAATGAKPFGLLLSLVLSATTGEEWLNQFKRGVTDAVRAYQTFIIGGDTNTDEHFSSAATAIAIQDEKPLTRKGIQPGHNMYASGLMGIGNAYAYSKLFDRRRKINYQPLARIKEMKLVRAYATACIDTSDGFFPALGILSPVNHTGFDISVPLENLLHPEALKLSIDENIPAWMLLAGPHGDYELLFSVPDENVLAFESACRKADWQPVYLGRAKKHPALHFISESMPVNCDPSLIADLFQQSNNNSQAYFNLLRSQHNTWESTLNLAK
jgi:thiamine-monophosphate kinase